MKKLFTIVAVTALGLALPSGSFAAAKTKPSATPSATPAATPGAAKPIPLYSQVTSIDAAGKSWTHKNADGKEVKFVVTDKTEITQKGNVPAKFEDIKVGDWVSGVRLKVSETEYEVKKITKFGPKTEKPEAGATPGAPAKPGDKKPK